MTADDPSDAHQRTVAELLAKYGDSATTGRRRARREAAEVEGGPSAVPALQHGVARTASNGAPNGNGAPTGVGPGRAGAASRTLAGTPPPVPVREPDTAPAGLPPARMERGSTGAEESPTEQLPRYAGGAGAGVDADLVGPPTRAVHPDELLADTGDSGAVGFEQPSDHPDPDEGAHAPPSASLPTAATAEDGDASQPARRRVDRGRSGAASATTAWLGMIAQWIAGAVGGAALWVAFRYLWSVFPVVALVAAVLVIAGLVLLVRAIRRSDDLKTTVFAVLVGLVVTVSPAVLVLVTR